ncbi:MAG TPA: AAA family ATPase [Acidimicrobiia bacterium]|nr:AAA family ATPase [Acidimicrobiia bacterium]
MFLKSLTLRGFKSFADKTVLDFEPGVTVVVGPNGSGKSNLVDAVAWVLGAQGARSLRGSKMHDVIFAGTSKRASLGRAEVSLTIDNTSGTLPIEFSEVTITRTLFRTGESEYQLNGAPCRLLDITELLSDSGIGRQQHVIVGQGQLDQVLNARPEDRRAIIEEAAGILKYRKRREKAERRLEATEASLLRLNDLLREVRRGLAPLQRQADAARRHDGLVAEARGIRLHLIGHEVAGLQTRLERLTDDAGSLGTRDREVNQRLAELDGAVMERERTLTDLGEDRLPDAMVRAGRLRERVRGLIALVGEKQRGLARELAAAADEGVIETLVADAAWARAELDGADEESAHLDGQVQAIAVAEAELDRDRAVAAEVRTSAESAVRSAEEAHRRADADAHRWEARAETLALALDETRDATRAEALAGIDGVIGPLVDHLEVEEGAEAAVAAALGDAMRAVVVEQGPAARAALDRLKRGDLDALLLVVDEQANVQGELAPPGTQPVANYVRALRPGVEAALARLLAGTVLVDGPWTAALDLVLARPDVTVVTMAGDRFGGRGAWVAGGGAVSGVTRATLDEARDRAGQAAAERTRADGSLRAARDQLAAVGGDVDERLVEVTRRRREVDVRVATLAERREMLAARLGAVEERLAAQDNDAQADAERARAALSRRATAYEELAGRIARHREAADALHDRLEERRRARTEAASAAGAELDQLRRERRTLEGELAGVRERSQRREVTEVETKLRLENVLERLRTDFDCEPAAALDAPAPEVPEGTTMAGRARDLEREIRLMGPINPLALEEYDALQERNEFLVSQLDDVKSSRRDLQRVIKAVDKEIVSVFEQAYADVERSFTDLFSTLFPGGSGRLTLTDSENLLTTGIEMEARPSGKNVRTLSLLSGGERSLTALAFLLAVFRARPSPFYLMDEVEAALDDVNLHRFLELVHEFRDEAQLLIVSHQKRTMEAADCLYGVSMPPGGSSRVVSQRMSGELAIT